jgi:pyruvate dehydrogenase E2 component (dihydrolipoamide acetyltransferase)
MPETAAPVARSRRRASPLASRTARRLGVVLDGLAGTGPHGRILKRDVAAAPARAREREHVTPSSSPAAVPQLTVETDVDMSSVAALHDEIRRVADPAPTIDDFLIKAAATALRLHPRVNGHALEMPERINVHVAVGAPGGVAFATVFDADRHSLTTIAAHTRALAARVRDGAETEAESAGATFGFASLAGYGVTRFAASVDGPQAATLCAGAIENRVRPLGDGTIGVVPAMTLTVVGDRRIAHSDAAAFLAELRRLLENPLAALL